MVSQVCGCTGKAIHDVDEGDMSPKAIFDRDRLSEKAIGDCEWCHGVGIMKVWEDNKNEKEKEDTET